ncbi:hypothetical protein NPN19_24210, partial [Vibrio parahaemolyticus]|uniref:hypothetical protein n=1 Tax=Vibrio parahaemolyticus TaxID=670 RepID=UPI002111E7BE
SWSMASTGLDVPWRRGMVERFFPAGAELFAVLSNGQLLSTTLSTIEWKRILPEIAGLNAITAVV